MLAKRILIFLGEFARFDIELLSEQCSLGHWPYVFAMRQTLRREYGDATPSKGAVNLNYWRLFELLESSSHFGCSDPREKLFAILTLFSPPIPKLLAPDYSKTISQVYTDLSWFLIVYEVSESLSLADASQAGKYCPSWVTNWIARREALPLHKGEFPDSPAEWRAGFPIHDRRVLSRRDDDTLIIRGLIVSDRDCVGVSSTLRDLFLFDLRSQWAKKADLQDYFLVYASSDYEERNEADQFEVSLRAYFTSFIHLCYGRRTFTTEDGREGLGPQTVQVGDSLCILLGYPTPFTFVMQIMDGSW